MAYSAKFILKFLSPRLIAKALSTLDRSTVVVVSSCWTAAAVTLILAVFAIHQALSLKKATADAAAIEPVLPVSSSSGINVRDNQMILDRLQHQFPDIKFEVGAGQSFVIKSEDGAKFHQWISAVSYIDTMEPHLRWTLQDFCVGACNGQDLMKAVVVGQRVVFTLPQP